MLHSNLSVNSAGHLVIGQSDVVELAMKYGTPLYILDEDRVRENCRKYKDAMSKYAAPGSAPLDAGRIFRRCGVGRGIVHRHAGGLSHGKALFSREQQAG